MWGKLYSSITFAASLFLGAVFLFFKRGRRRFFERYGCWDLLIRDAVWFHAASNGEMNGLLPVIRRFREEYPEVEVLVTAVSPSGLDLVGDLATATRLLPFDHPVWIRRALAGSRFCLFIFGETEIWPNVLSYLREQSVPRIMVNARISQYSFRWYVFLRNLMGEEISHLDALMASDPTSVERFIKLGARPERVTLCGNAKYDSSGSVRKGNEALELRARFLFDDAPVIVLGSLWPGEEKIWLTALRVVWEQGLKLNVLIAPRHMERISYFKNALSKAKVNFTRRTRIANTQRGEVAPANHVVILDTLGELESCYSFASLAFIGGSLVDVGGHNPLEAASYAVPVCMGPHRANVADICDDLEAFGALVAVESEDDIVCLLREVVEQRAGLRTRGEDGKKVWKAHQGATRRVMETVRVFMSDSSSRVNVGHSNVR